jgi:hypothetical protein
VVERPSGFDVEPAVGGTAASERKSVYAFTVDNDQLQVAVKGRGGDRFPLHLGVVKYKHLLVLSAIDKLQSLVSSAGIENESSAPVP